MCDRKLEPHSVSGVSELAEIASLRALEYDIQNGGRVFRENMN